MHMPSRYSSHIFLLSCAVCHVWTSFGGTNKDGSLKGIKNQAWKRCKETCGWEGCRTRNWQNVLWADSNKSVSCTKSSFRRSVRKTRKLSSPMGRRCSEHSYCRMSTPWPHAVIKKLVVLCYCIYHTLHSMATTRCSFALLTTMLVLAVFGINHLPVACVLWLAFGTGKSFRYLAAHQIAVSLRTEMSCTLPMFHAFTGWDNVSNFVGYGKKTAWSTWKSLPELTDVLVVLADGPKEIPDGAMNRITQAALEEHVKIAVYQGGHIRGGGKHCYHTLCCHHQLTEGG